MMFLTQCLAAGGATRGVLRPGLSVLNTRCGALGVARSLSDSKKGPKNHRTGPKDYNDPSGKKGAATVKVDLDNKEDLRKFLDISIDRSGLGKPYPEGPAKLEGKSVWTPLLEEIRARIHVQGPLPVAEYMREALTNPRHGYYMNSGVIGAGGDFITSPEISQMFGEMVAVWTMRTWEAIASPPRVLYVELGPGRGTLVADVLRAVRASPTFCKVINVHLVEASPTFRIMQRDSIAKALGDERPRVAEAGTYLTDYESPATGITVNWHSSLAEVPKEPAIFVLHEFLDALPAHQFQLTDRGWCERLIDLDTEDGPHHLRYVLSPGPTVAARVLLKSGQNVVKALGEGGQGATPATTIGQEVEICPEGWSVVEAIAKRIRDHNGAGLIVDYGKNSSYDNSLRGIMHHKFSDPLDSPGLADLSIHVDFAALGEMAKRNGAVPHGPITQGEFLHRLGIQARLTSLLRTADDKQAQELITAYQRLVKGGDDMGEIYKVMSILPASAAAEGGALTSL